MPSHAPLLPLAHFVNHELSSNSALFGLEIKKFSAQDRWTRKENASPRSLLPDSRRKYRQRNTRITGVCHGHYLSPQVFSQSLPPVPRYLPYNKWEKVIHFYDSQPFWLALYFCLNLSLTLHNKLVLVRFPFPYTLTALHALCGSIGGYLLLESGAFVPAKLRRGDMAVLAAFSILYAVNIVVSNLSLQLVTVPVSVLCSTATVFVAFTMLL